MFPLLFFLGHGPSLPSAPVITAPPAPILFMFHIGDAHDVDETVCSIIPGHHMFIVAAD